MSSEDQLITGLRAELADLTGTARVGPLCNLGKALLHRFSRNGPASPSALPDLDAAAAALEEALHHLSEGDPLRPNVSFLLGYALCGRNAYRADDTDRDAAIGLLEDALSAGGLADPLTAGAQVYLGTQYLQRAMAPMMNAQSMMGMLALNANQAHTQVPDLDRAADCFRAVLAGKRVSDDIHEMAQIMLELTDGCRGVLGGSPGGFTMRNMADAMAAMSKIQERLAKQAKPRYGPVQPADAFSFSNVGNLLNINPMDFPVAVVEGEMADLEPPAAPKPEPVEPARAEPVDLRESLRKRLSLTDADMPVWAAAVRLLSEVDTLPIAVVDDVVAMASTVVDRAADTDDPADTAVDWLLLAVTLHLRDRRDGTGADRQAGADALLTAARKVPVDHPAAAVILGSLGAFLDPDKPLGGVLDQAGAGFAGRFDAVLASDSVTDQEERANLHALRCVCRAAWAVAEAGRAAAGVSPGYPWPDPLKAVTGSPAERP